MKRVIKYILAVVAVVVIVIGIDFAFGWAMSSFVRRAPAGDTANHAYINLNLNDSIVVMGSSRANHHYVPDILEQRSEVSVYNAGTDANGIILAYMQLTNMLNRGHKPKLIIYDYFPKFDVFENNDHSNPLTRMRPFSNLPGMADVIEDLAPNENIKLLSNLYRYNSIFIQILSDNLQARQQVVKGYKPLYGKMESGFSEKSAITDSTLPDSLKLKYFNKFLELARTNDIEVVFVISPYYFEGVDFHIDNLRLLADDKTAIFDFSSHPDFVGHNELFKDPSHLNDEGAQKFSVMLADSLSSVF